MQSMQEARAHLAERKKYFEEQIGSYHSYVETAMNTMQRGKGYAYKSALSKYLANNYITGKSVL
jgi:RasGAP C-terminus